MRDEILAKAYQTDDTVKPRYNLVDKEGTVIAEGVEIQLINEIEQTGTLYSKNTVLPDDVAGLICPNIEDPTPADAFRSLQTKAPGGYGLGDTSTLFSWNNIDNIVVNGWYRCNTGDSIYIDGVAFQYAMLFVETWDENSVTQTLKPVNSMNYSVTRRRTVNGWTPWEWINPPMVPGVEYRTTKRRNGQVVYDKYVDFGVLPANGNKNVAYYDNIAISVTYEAFVITNSDDSTQGVYPVPFITALDGTVGLSVCATQNKFILSIQNNVKNFTGFAIVHYTKN